MLERSRARRVLFSLLVATSAAACSAGAPAAPPATAPGAPAAPPAAIGAESITADDLRAHVNVLASDEYAGRATLTPGADKARDYLAARFAAVGLGPLPGQSSLVVPYTLHEHGYDEAATHAHLSAGGEARDLVAGTDFAPLFFSSGEAVDAELVFAGYGITAPELDYDDYAGLDVEGKLVLVLRYTPDYDAESPRFDRDHARLQAKAKNAYDRGAAGILLVTGNKHAKAADDLRLSSSLVVPEPTPKADPAKAAATPGASPAPAASAPGAGARTPAASPRQPAGRGGAAPAEAQRPFMAIQVSRRATEWLLKAAAETDLASLERALDGGATPRTTPLTKARAKVAVRRAEAPRPVTPTNVIGFLPGSDPRLADEWVVIGGHYDHLGAFDGDGDTIYNGADDNASGTSGVLELAEAFASLPERPRRSLVFIGFSGEERGLLGSRAMLAEEQLPVDKVVFMLNLDMIGRNSDKPIDIVGDGYASGLRALVEAANEALGLELAFAGTGYSGASDHHPFYQRDVPFMFFFTGTHEDYHQLSDHADKIDFPRMEKIVRLAYGVVERVAAGERPRFIHQLLWLGATVEVQDVDGQPTAVVTSVDPTSRAARAGLAAGDRIAAIGEALDDARQVGARFRAIEPGSTFRLAVRRGAEALAFELERARPGFLGVMPREAPEELRGQHGLAADEGVLIAQVVPDGPADKAGFRAGDILIRIAGLPVGVHSLSTHLSRIGAGEKVEVLIIRDGTRVPLTMVLGERPTR